ncbi:MAG: hypothetical protein Q7T71_00215, partial [Herbiconiux sp.]|nr:hypothetical protein [Herbiconiux sp.]
MTREVAMGHTTSRTADAPRRSSWTPATPGPATPLPTVGTAPLAVRDLAIRFPRAGEPDLVIVEGLSFEVAGGQMHCLAGRSGSG